MESYEASRAVFSRVQSIDPENASEVMDYILLHHGGKDMIRFVYGPETLIVSIVNRAKTDLGLLSNNSPALPVSNPIAISRPNPLPLSISTPNHGFNPCSPSSPSIWSCQHVSPNANPSLSYAAAVNGTCNSYTMNRCFSSSSVGSSQIGFNGVNNSSRENLVNDCNLHGQNLAFLNDPLARTSKNVDFFDQTMESAMSPGLRSDSMPYPYWENSNSAENPPYFNRRSYSINESSFGTDDSTTGFGFKPCLYFARGFCKNGSTCKFVHGGFSESGDSSATIVGSPCKYDAFDQCSEELLRLKIAQQQRLAAQLIGTGMNLPCNKLNFLQSEAQRSAAAFLMSEEFYKLNRARMARDEFLRGDLNPSSRQIYLTFPADSTFKEDDVSEYFSRFGPVQDVRIPYQLKRMFGFVTFVYPETVIMILAKGNPHFVCDSRVLVKPYKEKGKLPDKKQHQQQLEREEFSCHSHSGVDCTEPFEFPLEMLMKKQLEEKALELQGRRLMNLQLLEMNNPQHQHDWLPGSTILSPNLCLMSPNHNALPASNGMNPDALEENIGTPAQAFDEGLNGTSCDSNDNVQNKEDYSKNSECEILESLLEHILPDSLFASPKKSVSIKSSAFSHSQVELNDGDANPSSASTANSDLSIPASSPLNLAPHKYCFFEKPSLSSGLGALGM